MGELVYQEEIVCTPNSQESEPAACTVCLYMSFLFELFLYVSSKVSPLASMLYVVTFFHYYVL